jgi:hypothetical protein
LRHPGESVTVFTFRSSVIVGRQAINQRAIVKFNRPIWKFQIVVVLVVWVPKAFQIVIQAIYQFTYDFIASWVWWATVASVTVRCGRNDKLLL